MRQFLTGFYDNYPGIAAALIITAGLALGGLWAYDPAAVEESGGGVGGEATPTAAARTPTQASISLEVPTATPAATTDPQFGTLVSPNSLIVFRDQAGFVSVPLPDPEGGVFLTGAGGMLYALETSGALRWSVDLATAPVGDLVMTPAGRLIVAERSGSLAAYDTGGGLVWEFSPGEGFIAVSGAALGPDGNLYYMLESGGKGFLQSVSPGGTQRWREPVETNSYRITPWIYPGGGLVFVKSLAYDLETGSPVALDLPFEVDAWITSTDGSAFLQRGQTITAWSVIDGAVTLSEDGPSFVIPDPGAIIRQTSIDLAGVSWIAYIGQTTDGIAWYDADGSLLHRVSTGNVLLSMIMAEDDQGILYACGPSPRDVSAEQLAQRSTYCLAFVPGEEKPRWQKPFAASAQFFVGSFRQGSEIFIATEEGDLVVLGRDENAAAVETESPPTGASALPNGWFWEAPEPVVNHLELLPDGTLPLMLADGRVFFLSPDGSLAGTVELPEFRGPEDDFHLPVYFYPGNIAMAILPEKVYAMQADAGQLWEFPVAVFETGDPQFPTLQLQYFDGGEVKYLLDSANTLHAFTPEEGLQWSFVLEEGLLEDFGHPALAAGGRLYFAGSQGTLFAFDPSGLAWEYHPGGSLRSASDPALGPDGNIYYVATSGSSGTLQSLTPAGDLRWSTQLETFRFYNTPQFTGDGAHLRVADDFVETAAGSLVAIEFPFEVNQFIHGRDGNDYLQTGNHIIRWQIGPEGYEEVRSYTVNMEGTNQFILPFITVHETGAIEIRIFDSTSAHFLWVDPETGEVFSTDSPFGGFGIDPDPGDPGYVTCAQDLEALTLTCTKTLPGASEATWSLTIQGISGAVSGFPTPILYEDGRLFLIGDQVNVYMLEVEIP